MIPELVSVGIIFYITALGVPHMFKKMLYFLKKKNLVQRTCSISKEKYTSKKKQGMEVRPGRNLDTFETWAFFSKFLRWIWRVDLGFCFSKKSEEQQKTRYWGEVWKKLGHVWDLSLFFNFWDGFGGWILETHFFQIKIEDQQKSRPNEILMTYGIFSIKPTKWFLGYLTSQKPLESFANMCSLVFIKICWYLIFLVSILRFFKTNRFWKWFQTQMRSWWPMESFLSNQQNDSWGIWHLKSLWNHLQICVLWFSLKSVDLWFFVVNFEVFQNETFLEMIPNPNEILMTYGIFSIKPTKWFLGYLTSQKPLESFANMCSLVFIKIGWFLTFWCQFWGFSKRTVFGNDSKPKWDLDDPWNLFYQTNKMILGAFDISKACGIICKYVFFGFH